MEELSQEQFRIIGIEDNGTEHSARKKVGYWQDAWTSWAATCLPGFGRAAGFP